MRLAARTSCPLLIAVVLLALSVARSNANLGPHGGEVAPPLEGLVYFAASDRVHGRELWRSDGTAEGTFMVKDIGPREGWGSIPLIGVDGLLYFRANDGKHGTELWVTDGSSVGTRMVADIRRGPKGSKPVNLIEGIDVIGDVVYFTARDGIHGRELWRSDGTAAGTRLVKDIRVGANDPNPYSLEHIGDTLFFFADDGIHGQELWKSDGTRAGTVMVADIAPGPDGADPYYSSVSADLLYFRANDGTHGMQLWTSDGTAGGTLPLTSLTPRRGGVNVWGFGALGPESFFTLCARRCLLWKTDGTRDGTRPVPGRPDAYSAAYYDVAVVVEAIFFYAEDELHGAELWTSDGTPGGTHLLSDIYPGPTSSGPHSFVAVGDRLFFIATGAGTGSEVWVSDGTTSGTRLTLDLPPGDTGAFSQYMLAAGSSTIFTAVDEEHGDALWRSDGTATGTFMVADVDPWLSAYSIVAPIFVPSP